MPEKITSENAHKKFREAVLDTHIKHCVELTQEQISQQDSVDNLIHTLLGDLHIGYGEWDMEKISTVREAIQDVFNMTQEERYSFYPWLKEA